MPLASRLARISYSRPDCAAALRGTSLPQNLGNNVNRLALVAGIRKHVGLARLPELAELCAHSSTENVFARARNARLIMSGEIPTEDMMGDDCIPYCICLKYQVGRACAVGGYIDLYRDLNLLPDTSIAEEARENAGVQGAQEIYDLIMAAPTRYKVMDDYTRTISASPSAGAQLNADTAVIASLKSTRKYGADFRTFWKPFNITEDWGIAEKSIFTEPPVLGPEETELIDGPLPSDLPTMNKHLLILMAAYMGNVDRYARLRRPLPVRAELICLVRGIYHSTFMATWLARNESIIDAVGRHPADAKTLRRAIHARRVMNNDIAHVTDCNEAGEWTVPDDELPYWIWYPAMPQRGVMPRLAQLRPAMAVPCLRACIAANYREDYQAIMRLPDVSLDSALEFEAKLHNWGGYYIEDLSRRQMTLGLEYLPADRYTWEWKEMDPWREGNPSSEELIGELKDSHGEVSSGQDGGMYEGSGLETGRIELWNLFSQKNIALRRIPGPFYASFTKLRLKYAVLTGDRTAYIHHLHQQFGPIVRISPEEVSIADPEASKLIHKAGSGYQKSDWYGRFIARPVPTMFTMEDSKSHAVRRKMFARAFSKTEIRTKWEPMVKETVQLAVEKIFQDMIDGEANVYKWWLSMAADVSVHLMFGESFHILEKGEINNYFRVLQLAGKGGAIADELPLLGFIGRRIPHSALRDLFKSNDYLTDFGAQAISNGMKKGKEGASIFRQLDTSDGTMVNDKSTSPLTPQDLSTEAGNFIIAGTDTTGFTLTCLVWAVLDRPALQSALEEEVAGLKGGFNDAQLETLPLLNAVINETLRLYGPAAASLPRIVPQGGAVLGGYFIPESVTVSTQAWTLHRNEHFWHDPERFDPHRWLNDSAKEASRSAFAAFGAGPRICIGMHLAMMEIRFAVALFFRRCRGARISSGAAKTLEFDNYFLLRPKGTFTIVAA
ncbi:sterigmatocystin biosynthesis P450 monooxygenase STCB [Paramyrothecium foliicola]|nr:sterigmatocystin biosynthesis P450 monooxygenase STCB [Paramyrothecium foliicola]